MYNYDVLTETNKTNIIDDFTTFYTAKGIVPLMEFQLNSNNFTIQGSYVNCIDDKSYILMSNKKYVNIKELKEGDCIITSKNKVAKIEKIVSELYDNELITLKVNQYGWIRPFMEFGITPRHKIYNKNKELIYPSGKVEELNEKKMIYHLKIRHPDNSFIVNGLAIEGLK